MFDYGTIWYDMTDDPNLHNKDAVLRIKTITFQCLINVYSQFNWDRPYDHCDLIWFYSMIWSDLMMISFHQRNIYYQEYCSQPGPAVGWLEAGTERLVVVLLWSSCHQSSVTPPAELRLGSDSPDLRQFIDDVTCFQTSKQPPSVGEIIKQKQVNLQL